MFVTDAGGLIPFLTASSQAENLLDLKDLRFYRLRMKVLFVWCCLVRLFFVEIIISNKDGFVNNKLEKNQKNFIKFELTIINKKKSDNSNFQHHFCMTWTKMHMLTWMKQKRSIFDMLTWRNQRRNTFDIVLRFLMAMRTLDEWERAWLPAPIPEC